MNTPFKSTLSTHILEDLQEKMVLLSGPRQVGKTTLAKQLVQEKSGSYLLYDNLEDKNTILNQAFLHKAFVCLDEFHKYHRWKSFLKGVYDKHKEQLQLLVTGSARLDIYQKSGDSLFGRYFLHTLHPLTIGELGQHPLTIPNLMTPHPASTHLPALLRFGGFPEPFFKGTEAFHRRWTQQRAQLLIHEDMRELTQIQLLNAVDMLMTLLPDRIGSPLSMPSLSQSLHVSVPTVQAWMSVFERLFITYKVLPYATSPTRSLTKQSKYYLWDWSIIPEAGIRFENLVASHLYKGVSTWHNLGLATCGLYFLRDRDGREVDFIVTKDHKPWFLVEVKLADETPSAHLYYYAKKLGIPGYQIIQTPGVFHDKGMIKVISADQWLGHF